MSVSVRERGRRRETERLRKEKSVGEVMCFWSESVYRGHKVLYAKKRPKGCKKERKKERKNSKREESEQEDG
jgi:hypothetical protein